ncbi:monooxygenase [Streptomyces tateyamensis]|uniref:Monooxygenase n=1 Tax=Streptomyces tateyamensis TaxID=565073 RepID=A0A2V4NKH2_9ACTN|nr:FAD-dependent monooxygenase [Streptomyces tateyamensis]PYC72359.1 monooxygenase [Streptomyces tateyamensis]
MHRQSPYPVLVVGAGPVGLTSAVELLRRGVPVRIVDRAAAPSPLSKALLVWPRTLEILRRLGGERHIAEQAMPLEAFRYYSSGTPVATIAFRADTKPVIMPQPDVEAALLDALAQQGGAVEWSTELLELEQHEDHVTAVLRAGDGSVSTATASHLIGGDGASSKVRELLGIAFEGHTYGATFVVADAEMDGGLAHDISHYYCSPKGVLVTCGLPNGRFRVFTSAPPDLPRDQVTLELVQKLVDERGPGGLTLRNPTWVSAFSVHARHADHTREGRVFLLGDAAHIHSPAGGQGLNTGVGDAYNLAWKLALVHRGLAGDQLLDTAETERRQVAEAIVKQADLQTKAWMLPKRHQRTVRDLLLRAASAVRLGDYWYVPWLAGLRTVYQPADGQRPTRAAGFESGALVGDRPVWDARSSRRLPLRESLSDLGHTLLVVTRGTPLSAASRRAVAALAERYGALLELRTLDASAAILRDGVAGTESASRRGDRPALVLVRPDQHVALAVPVTELHRVAEHLDQLAPAGTPVGSAVPAAA